MTDGRLASTAQPEGAPKIATLFNAPDGITRQIEKVIDYYRDADDALEAEVNEYQITRGIERNFRRFLDAYRDAVTTGNVHEIGVWVSGFYGSGKSSFTKYLGFALDAQRLVNGHPFAELLASRIENSDLRQDFRTLTRTQPATVINLDLASDQLVSDTSQTVTNVLYWKVLQWAGYSRVQILADFEYILDRQGRLEEFHDAYETEHGQAWKAVHNDRIVGVRRAAVLASRLLPDLFPDADAFIHHRTLVVNDTVRDRASAIIDLIRRKSGRQNIIFMIDEAGQYIAPRRELMLNLQGLAQQLKELGSGRVWIVATGQQTLSDLVDIPSLNSPDLARLKDRFPLSLELDSSDIQEITHRRLLRKTVDGDRLVRSLFTSQGPALITRTRLSDTTQFGADPTEDQFAALYPFLPSHFGLLLDTVRALARTAGGALGLRSAIRLVQDVLVSATGDPGNPDAPLADQPVGALVSVDRFYDILKADIRRSYEFIPDAVDRVSRAYPGNPFATRVAKAIGVLQPLDGFPRTAENLAALLHRRIEDQPAITDVKSLLQALVQAREIGLIEDPQTGGFSFLNAGIMPLRKRRDDHVPAADDLAATRNSVLREIFADRPATRLLGTKAVNAGVRLRGARGALVGEREEIQFQVEFATEDGVDGRRTELLTETVGAPEWRTMIAWVCVVDGSLDERLREIVRSDWVASNHGGQVSDPAVAQYVRGEQRASDTGRRKVRELLLRALLDGTLIFRGAPIVASTLAPSSGVHATSLTAVAKAQLERAASAIYPLYHLAKVTGETNLAPSFLDIENLTRMPPALDPLEFVGMGAGGMRRVDPTHPTLDEAKRAFEQIVASRGVSQLTGSSVLDHFSSMPYGWTKDTTRYVFAALFRSGIVKLLTQTETITVVGPTAVEAFRTTLSFNRCALSRRNDAPSLEMLQRTAARLTDLIGRRVLMDQDTIARAVREYLPGKIDPIRSLPTQLAMIGIDGGDRAERTIAVAESMLIGDGMGAVQHLGALTTSFPDDYAWAVMTAEQFAGGADREIREARELLRNADAIADLDPVALIVPERARNAIEEIEASRNLAADLALVRTARREVEDAARSAFTRVTEAGMAERDAARQSLEGATGWAQLPHDERDRIRNTIGEALDPSRFTAGDPVDLVRRVVIARLRLAGEVNAGVNQVATLVRAVVGQTIREAESNYPPATVAPATAAPHAVQLSLVGLLNGNPPISTVTELDRVLDAIRTRVTQEIDAGRSVRLEA